MKMQLALALAVALGAGGAAAAFTVPATSDLARPGIVTIAEHCGNGWWRDQYGVCHPFHTPYGNLRGTVFACPPGYHIGGYGQRCHPNY